MLFRYKAKNQNGEVREGQSEAKDQLELARGLRADGFYIVDIDTVSTDSPSAVSLLDRFHLSGAFNFLGSVSLTEKMLFSRNLSVMLSSGVPLIRSLSVLKKQVKSKRFKGAITHMARSVERGKRFSDAVAEQSNIFNTLYVSMVRAGEAAGNLDDSLNILANQMEKEHELKSRIRGALVYPSVIIVVMVVIGVIMMVTVVPSLTAVFEDFDAALPPTTAAIFAASALMQRFWWAFLAAVPVVGLAVRTALNTPGGNRALAWMLLHAPMFRTLVVKINNAIFARTLSSLIAGGVSILDGLSIASTTVSNVYYRDTLVAARTDVQKGKSLFSVLEQHSNLYTALVIEMVEVGEETGKLSELLERIAQFYEEEISDATKNLSSVIEPVLMVVIGSIVGLFAISVIQPIYGLLGQI
jgi:type IV pilus assembly protein PilC